MITRFVCCQESRY